MIPLIMAAITLLTENDKKTRADAAGSAASAGDKMAKDATSNAGFIAAVEKSMGYSDSPAPQAQPAPPPTPQPAKADDGKVLELLAQLVKDKYANKSSSASPSAQGTQAAQVAQVTESTAKIPQLFDGNVDASTLA